MRLTNKSLRCCDVNDRQPSIGLGLEKTGVITSSKVGLYIELTDLATSDFPLGGCGAERTDKGNQRTGGEELIEIGAARSTSGRGQLDIDMSAAASDVRGLSV